MAYPETPVWFDVYNINALGNRHEVVMSSQAKDATEVEALRKQHQLLKRQFPQCEFFVEIMPPGTEISTD